MRMPFFLIGSMVNLNFHLLDLFIDALDMRCDARLTYAAAEPRRFFSIVRMATS